MTGHDDEIERRLRADAARFDADDVNDVVPSFGDALAVVTEHRRPLTWLAVAASVLLVTGIAVAVGLRGGSGGQPTTGSFGTDPPRPPPSGVPSTRGDERLFYFANAGFDGVILDPGDPRVLGVVVPFSKEPGDCSLFGATARIVSQGPAGVTIGTAGFQYLKDTAAHQKYSGFSCAGGGVAVVRVRLNAPLGSRTVEESFERAPGALGPGPVFTIPADPTDLPSPAYLPSGYRLNASEPASLRSGRLVGQRTYTDGSATLTFEVGPATALDQTSKNVVGHGRVSGVASVITAEPHQKCITWRETSELAARTRQLCSDAEPALGSAELLATARSVP